MIAENHASLCGKRTALILLNAMMWDIFFQTLRDRVFRIQDGKTRKTDRKP